MGGSCPNSDLSFFWKSGVFLCCFFAVHDSEKKNGQGDGWVMSDQSEFVGFLAFFLT